MSKYNKLSREELLDLIKKQDKELANKKYGLVWDSEKVPEKVVQECKNNLPILKRVKDKEIRVSDVDDNILIEGDNYHALTVLNYTHKGKIDCIYIDPPYNTGNKDFIYNDLYIDKEDGYRHSKWLNFMQKRLKLAYILLKNTGVMFISIDDNEQAPLKMLCDNIFGEENFIETLIWKKRATAPNDRSIGRIHEYIHAYSKSENVNLGLLPRDAKSLSRYSNPDNDPRGEWVASDLSASGKGGRLVKSCIYPIKNPKDNSESMPPKGKCWLFNKNKMDTFIQEKRIGFREKTGTPYLKRYLSEVRDGITLPTIMSEQGNSLSSTREIEEILGKGVFEHPKPTKLIKTLLQVATREIKNSTILDFMAGSGTTGHAVLELNKEDKGNRKFILCTNNENNICTEVCYPRLKKVIKGYTTPKGQKVMGLNGNLQYFKTDLIKKTKNRDQVKLNLTRKCTEMLCVKENIFNLEKRKSDYKIFSSNKKDKYLCVYFNFLENSFNDFIKELKVLKGKKKIYMFSTNDEVDNSLFEGVKNYKIEAIPQKILDIYRQLVLLNIKK